MHGIVYSREAVKALRRLPANTRTLIIRKLKELARDPQGMRNVRKLSNHPGYRLRIGDWRVIFRIENNPDRIAVINIAPRGGVYK